MLYNILRILGVCLMIMAYFGGFLITIAVGMWISEKIDLYFYQKRMEIATKYANSIYNNHRDRNHLYLGANNTSNNESQINEKD